MPAQVLAAIMGGEDPGRELGQEHAGQEPLDRLEHRLAAVWRLVDEEAEGDEDDRNEAKGDLQPTSWRSMEAL
jgi:hypothetical protein